MNYKQLRAEVLHYLDALQERKFSYQSICDYVNSQQNEFVLYKDFFSRFRSKSNYYRSPSKQKKLTLIHRHMQDFYRQHVGQEEFLHEGLKEVISEAISAKFESYLDINRSSKSHHPELAKFYLENSPAFLSIINDLRHKEQYQWQLDVLSYGSTYRVLSAKVSHLFKQNAMLETKEYWKLCWVDGNIRQLQYKHESIGPHTYLLSKDQEGHWKVMENLMNHQTNKITPPYIDYPLLAKLASRHWAENRKIANNFLENHEILECMAFVKGCFSRRLTASQGAILDQIKKSYLNSHRLLNTDVINFSAYQAEIALLQKQTQLICDGIFLANK